MEWYALRVGMSQFNPAGAAAPLLETPVFVGIETTGFVIDRRRVRALAVAVRTHLGVQGNHFLSWGGGAPIVRVESNDSCSFSSNQCFLSQDGQARNVVALMGRAVIASSNTVRRPSDADAMDIDGQVFTVVGNVTFGNIRIRGNILPAPWNALNVLSA